MTEEAGNRTVTREYTFKDATEEDLTRIIAWIDDHGLSDHNLKDLQQWAGNSGYVSFISFQNLITHLENNEHNNDHLDTYLVGNQVTRVE